MGFIILNAILNTTDSFIDTVSAYHKANHITAVIYAGLVWQKSDARSTKVGTIPTEMLDDAAEIHKTIQENKLYLAKFRNILSNFFSMHHLRLVDVFEVIPEYLFDGRISYNAEILNQPSIIDQQQVQAFKVELEPYLDKLAMMITMSKL